MINYKNNLLINLKSKVYINLYFIKKTQKKFGFHGFYYLYLHSQKFKVIFAKIAQLVERNLAKVEVAGSNPVFRSN